MTKRKKNRKSYLIIGVIAILVIFGVLLSYRQSSPISINEVNNPLGSVDLNLTPADSAIEPGTSKTLAINVSSSDKHLTGVQAEISYNSVCGIPIVTKGDFLPIVLASAKVENGKISFSYGAAPDSGGVSGSGVIATIQVTPTTSGRCDLIFTSGTIATVTESSVNELRSTEYAWIRAYTIAEPSGSPTVSANPSPSASPSVTPSPTPSRTTTLRSSTVTCNSLSFSWDKIDGAKGYIIDLAENSNFDNKVSSGTLGSDRDNYSFGNLKNGTQYYARVTQTDIHDFPRYTQLGPISTLGSCAGAATTLTSIKPSAKVTPQPSASLKPSPTTLTSATPRPSLTPTSYTDSRFDNPATENEGETEEQSSQSFFSRFIAWLASLFD